MKVDQSQSSFVLFGLKNFIFEEFLAITKLSLLEKMSKQTVTTVTWTLKMILHNVDAIVKGNFKTRIDLALIQPYL